MDWRIKCALQHVFSAVPGGRRLNYLAQRYVQRSLPFSEKKLQEYRNTAALHLATFRDLAGGSPADVFEFGSGQSLSVSILMGMQGCRVFATDIGENAEPEIVADVLSRLGAPPSLEEVNVTYRAPYSRAMAADHSFDLIMSTSVLEHVPIEQLPPLLYDCRRILKPNGLCSFLIDYQDHWAGFDRSITVHNFLRYGRRSWPLFNPSLQYQNRLRHSDYLAAFSQARFRTVSVQPRLGEPPAVPLAPEFHRYNSDDLRTTGAHFVLAKT